MRRVVSIFFVTLFLFNIVGHYPVFVVRQYLIQNELDELINDRIASGSLVLLSFSPQEIKSLKWIKKNEFGFRDEMYDIVMQKNGENGRIDFYCFHDTKEKKLFADFEKHLQKNMENASGNQKNEQNFNKNLLKDYCPPESFTSIAVTGIEINYNRVVSILNSIDPEDQSPPPKVA